MQDTGAGERSAPIIHNLNEQRVAETEVGAAGGLSESRGWARRTRPRSVQGSSCGKGPKLEEKSYRMKISVTELLRKAGCSQSESVVELS